MTRRIRLARRYLGGMLPVFDCHADALQRALDLGHDLGRETHGHLDLVRGRRGGLAAVVLTAWIDGPYAEESGAAKRRTNALLDAADDLFARHPQSLRQVVDGADLLEPNPAHLACVLAIEGGHAIEDDLDQLDHYASRGVRVMTLTWNNHLSWARSCRDGAGSAVPEGLSKFGVQVVERMGELGMLVDLSHAGERTFYDALEAAAAMQGCWSVTRRRRSRTTSRTSPRTGVRSSTAPWSPPRSRTERRSSP
ncbi:dipeptidase [Planctomycetota bacterium]|nr:dipeptidase [Planctomycetota bacterium]